MKGIDDPFIARKIVKYYLMMHGISGKEIDGMDDEEVVLLNEFVVEYEEIEVKRLAVEIAKAVWGQK